MADKMITIDDLMITGLTYVLDFENKVSEEANKMAEASSDPELKQVFQQSASKGKEYAQRVQQVFAQLGQSIKTNDNQVAEAMVTEVEQMITNTDATPIRDAALIVAANQMQHYRVVVYGSLAHYAQLIGKDESTKTLAENLEDSKGGDEKLTRIEEQNVNQKAVKAAA